MNLMLDLQTMPMSRLATEYYKGGRGGTEQPTVDNFLRDGHSDGP